jgi:hypothetical protein
LKPQLKICLLHTLEKVFCKDQKQDMIESRGLVSVSESKQPWLVEYDLGYFDSRESCSIRGQVIG